MEYKELEQIALVKGGKRLPKGHQLVDNKTNHPYLRITDYSNGYVDLEQLKYIKDETFEIISRYTISSGDVFLSIVGTIGIVDCIDDSLDGANLTENAVKIEVKNIDEYNSIYLSYYLKSPEGQHEINSRTVGSTQKKLAIKRIKKILVPDITIEKQNKIANILKSYDKKIETNNKIIANLEAQAQALFKYYFVDFEPFSDGNFVDSKLGNIPENWTIKKVDKICDLMIGRTPPRKETECFSSKDGVKWVSIKDMGDAHVFIDNTSEYLTEEAVEKYRVPMVDENTLIMSFKLTVGRIAITMDKMTTNEAIAHFNNTIISENYLYYYFKNFNFNSLGNTSSIGNAVNSKIIKNIDVLIPTDEILEIFDLKVKVIMDFIRNLTKQNQTLAEARDALLPRLMAGEIDLEGLGGSDD